MLVLEILLGIRCCVKKRSLNIVCLFVPVVMAQVSHPIPFRTRSLNPVALMVLCLKTRESRSLPELISRQESAKHIKIRTEKSFPPPSLYLGRIFLFLIQKMKFGLRVRVISYLYDSVKYITYFVFVGCKVCFHFCKVAFAAYLQ